MRRVLVIGSGGAGKSTFARRLGERTGLPVIHLDAAFWKPGWVEPPADEWRRTVERLVEGDRWIMDGHFGGTLDLRLSACDTAIFLDRSRWLCFWRVTKRALRHDGRGRPDMAPGCSEKADWAFLRWVWGFPRERRPALVARLAELGPGKSVVTLRSDADVEAFLASTPPD